MENKKIKVKLEKDAKGNKVPLMLYESDREVTEDEVREWCEDNDTEVPAKYSREWWDIEAWIKEPEWEMFTEFLKLPEQVVVTGSTGLWDGPRAVCTAVDVDPRNPEAFFGKFEVRGSCFEMAIGYDEDGLFVRVSHHDGTNRYHIRELTERGKAYLDRCEEKGVDPERLDSPGYSRKIDWYVN